MFLLKRGKLIKEKLKFFGALSNRLERAKELGNEELRKVLEETMEQEKSRHHGYLDSLPQTFGKNYGDSEYRRDIENVINYYTKWNREDVFESKASLRRIRRYEKREGLRPFDEVLIKEKRTKELDRLSAQG